MSRASSHALKHPPVAAPSEPAGALSPFPELAVAIERERRRGRGAQSNASGRFEAEARVAFDDGWQSLDELPPFKTTVALDTARKVITRNDSPDIGFDRSINPYRGCEHGCVYCFARPTHAYLGLSPGLDFESKLFAKPDAPQLLEKELAAQDYEPRMIAIGTNTDPYQPIERERNIMRGVLEVLDKAGHPVGIVTKSALVTRDIDILARMAKRSLAKVAISVTTLDAKLARTMEPRASTPAKRLSALRHLSEAGIPTTVMVAPVIPALNDSEIERILGAAAHAGVKEASYVLNWAERVNSGNRPEFPVALPRRLAHDPGHDSGKSNGRSGEAGQGRHCGGAPELSPRARADQAWRLAGRRLRRGRTWSVGGSGGGGRRGARSQANPERHR